MHSKLNEFSGYFDYFKQPVKLMFNKQEKVSTTIGFIFSVIIFSVSIALAISMGADIYNRTNPNVAYTTTTLEEVPIFNMTQGNLRFIALMQDPNGIPFHDPRYFTLNILLYQNIRFSNSTVSTTKTPFKQVNCSIHYEYFNITNSTKDYDSNRLGEGYCFDPTSLSIGGSYLENYFANINYQVFKCVNSTANNNTCKPLNEINTKLYNSKFQMYYFDAYVDTNNYSNPIISYFNNYFIKIDSGMYKYSNLYLKKTTVDTDDGLIFESKNKDIHLTTDYFREQFFILQNQQLISFYMNISNNFLNVKRNYSKLQNLAATVGGIFSIMTIFAELISSFFVRHKIYAMLFNALFFMDENDQRNATKINHFRIDKVQNIRSSPHIKLQNSSINVINTKNINSQLRLIEGVEKVKEKDLPKNKKLALFNLVTNYKSRNSINPLKQQKQIKNYELGLVKILQINIFYCFKSNEKHKKLFDEAYRKLTKYLDFLDFARVIQELQKLKKIIFDKSQQELFSYLNKPIIHAEKEKRTVDVDYFRKCYQDIISKQSMSKKDLRLIEQLDENIKALLN